MGCPCANKLRAILACLNDGRRVTIRYKDYQTPLEAVAVQRKRCSKCYESNFEVVEEGL